jgi:hypothetical protein
VTNHLHISFTNRPFTSLSPPTPTPPTASNREYQKANLHPPPHPDAFFEDEVEQTYQEFVDMGRRNPNKEGTGKKPMKAVVGASKSGIMRHFDAKC